MPQFDVHRNTSRSRTQYPYLIIVQSGLLRRWDRRIVIPMAVGVEIAAHTTMTPSFEIEGRQVNLITHQVGNVPREALGDVVANLEASAETILNALDLVFSRAFPDMSRPAAQ